MRILLDQNISFRVINKLDAVFEAVQVRELGLEGATDNKIWKYAKDNNYSVVTFDADFYNMSILYGIPPKIIWLRTGNLTTPNIANILNQSKELIHDFLLDDNLSCLELIKN